VLCKVLFSCVVLGCVELRLAFCVKSCYVTLC